MDVARSEIYRKNTYLTRTESFDSHSTECSDLDDVNNDLEQIMDEDDGEIQLRVKLEFNNQLQNDHGDLNTVSKFNFGETTRSRNGINLDLESEIAGVKGIGDGLNLSRFSSLGINPGFNDDEDAHPKDQISSSSNKGNVTVSDVNESTPTAHISIDNNNQEKDFPVVTFHKKTEGVQIWNIPVGEHVDKTHSTDNQIHLGNNLRRHGAVKRKNKRKQSDSGDQDLRYRLFEG